MTGLSAKNDKIIEIGAARVRGGEIVDTISTLVNPKQHIPQRVQELTGITDSDVENAADMDEAVDNLLNFIGDDIILGQNVTFDYSFLKRAAVNQGLEFERTGLDTLQLCRRFMPQEEKKNLEAACRFFEIQRQGAHRALGDAEDAHSLYQRLIALYGETEPGAFAEKPLIYKVKREQPASKKQKEDLRYLLKYHKIDLPVQIDYLSRNEASRITDQVISQYGRIRH